MLDELIKIELPHQMMVQSAILLKCQLVLAVQDWTLFSQALFKMS